MVLPEELQCPICSSLLEDAVMMPCCAGSACDSCARSGIMRSVGSACPVCGEVASTEELIPYRLFRDKVDKFCTQTGYLKARPPQQHHQPHKPPKPSLPDIVLPTLQSHRPLGSSVTDSPRGTSPPRPRTPTSSPPRSPGTPLSYPERRTRSRSPVTPYSHHDRAYGRGTPTTSPEYILKHRPPGPTLLPPVHVLAPPTHWPPHPPHLLSAPVQHPPTFLHPAEDPLAAFEAAMRKLDSKKSSRGRLDPASPPRAYRVEMTRSRSRERLRDYRERDYSQRRRSPGGYGNCFPRERERGSSRGSMNEGKSRGDKEDFVDSSWSRPRRERYVTDIPPETQEERRDRERFEMNLAKMDTGSYRPKIESRGRAALNLEYQERKMTENKAHGMDTRTSSLSPEPDIGEFEYGRWENTVENKDKKALNLEKLRGEREKCGTKFKKEEEYKRSSYQDHKRVEVYQSDRSHDRGGDRKLSSYDGHREENARGQDEHQDGLNKPRKRGDWKQDGERSRDRSRGRDLVYVMKSESNRKLTAEPEKEKSIYHDLKREMSIEAETKVHESLSKVYEGGRGEDDKILNQAAKLKSEEVKEIVKTEQGKTLSLEKESTKVKKSKKSKKNKSKDKELRKCNKESRKRKKNKKREEINEEFKPEEDVKSLVPYDEAEDTKTEDSSAENQEDESSLTANFISSFMETKIEIRRPELDLPPLVSNKKTEDLGPKEVHSIERKKAILAKLQLYSESLPSISCKEDAKGHIKAIEIKMNKNASDDCEQAYGSPEFEAVPSVSKWEREDILTAEYPELMHPLVANPESALELPKPCIQESSSGPQNVLRKALANMEKDHLLREKKRKSMEGLGLDNTKSKKKKKKSKKKKSRGENVSSEDETKLKVKKTKKKKSGLDISEKTLKKLLKKNLIRKEALEKMISDEGVRKKRKKKYSDGKNGKGKTRQSSSEDEMNKMVVKVELKVERLGCLDGKTLEERRYLKEEKTKLRSKEVGEQMKGSRRGTKRGSSEEGREVKSSREGKLQVRLANSSNRESSPMTPGKKSLTSIVQANLLKMAGQDSSGRGEGCTRKSVKDRLGPLRREQFSPVRRSSLRENERKFSKLDDHRPTGNRLEGRKQFGGDADESKKGADENIGEDRLYVLESGGLEPVPATLQAWAGRHSPVKQDRDTRWRKEEDDNRGRKKDASVEKSCKERRKSREKASLQKRSREKRHK